MNIDLNQPYPQEATMEDVYYAYRLILKRNPDPGGLESYRQLIDKGLCLDDMIAAFIYSKEYKQKWNDENKLTEIDMGNFILYARFSDRDTGREIIQLKQYEPHVTKVISDHLHSGDVMVDIGANIGYFTMLGASIVGNRGTIYAIEPNPGNVQLIYAGIVRNCYENVRVLPYGASDGCSVFSMVVGLTNGHLVTPETPGEANIYTQTIVLDDFFIDNPKIDVVKIDVEGHELRTFSGFKKSLEKFRPIVATEFHPKLLRENGDIEPEEYLRALFGLYNSAGIILTNGSIKKCSATHEIMDFWKQINEEKKMDGDLHIDILFTNV